MGDVLSILQVAIGIGFLIFIHELGHFLAARAAGITVETFSLGFGPRLIGFRKGATYYQLAAIPVGGYVRVAGEDLHGRPREGDLMSKSVGARAAFYSGGVVMNLLFALVAFPIVFAHGVDFQAPVIGEVQPGGAAWQAGLLPGDEVLSIDGKDVYSFDNVFVETALAGDDPTTYVIRRGDEQFAVDIEPRYSERHGLYELGATPALAPVPPRVTAVDASGPAAEAGIRPGDRIVAIDGEAVVGESAEDAITALLSGEPGRTVEMTLERDGERRDIEITTGSRTLPTQRIGVRSAEQRVIAVRPTQPVLALELRPGDRILALDGSPFWSAQDLERLRAGTGPTTLLVERDGVRLPKTAELDAEARATLAASIAVGPNDAAPVVVPDPDSPAAAAGLRAGDRILKAADRPVRTWDELRDAVASAGDRPVRLEVERGSETLALEIRPSPWVVVDLGMRIEFEELRRTFKKESVGGALKAGGIAAVDLVKQLYVTLKRLVTGDVAARNLGGIVTISRASYRYAQSGLAVFVYFLALLSINLGFINVLPIPVLDGGHLMFLLIEKIKGSPVSARVMNYSQILGLVFVIALMVFVTYNDILRLL